MPVEFRPLQRSFVARDGLYDELSGGERSGTAGYDEQDRFRRELENYLLAIVTEIDGAITRLSTEASLATKRDSFVVPTVGIVSYI